MRKRVKLKFPVFDKRHQPVEDRTECATCGLQLAWNRHPQRITLSAGAAFDSSDRIPHRCYDLLVGFWGLFFHANTSPQEDVTTELDIAIDVKGGQFDIHFCSTNC